MPKFLVSVKTTFEAEIELTDNDLREMDINPSLDQDDLFAAVTDMLVDNWQEFLTLADEATVPEVSVKKPDSTYILPKHFEAKS